MSDFLKMVKASARFAKPAAAPVAATAIADGSAAWSRSETAKLQSRIKTLKDVETKSKVDFFGQNKTATPQQQSANSKAKADPNNVLGIPDSDEDEDDDDDDEDFDEDDDGDVVRVSTKRSKMSGSSSASASAETALLAAAPALSLKQLMAKHSIYVTGSDVPPLVESFSAMERRLNIPRHFLTNLVAPLDCGGFGFTAPTPVQMQTVPALLARREVLSFAPTGSGKTVAFALPLLALLDKPPARHELEGTRWRRSAKDDEASLTPKTKAAAGNTATGLSLMEDSSDSDPDSNAHDDDDDDDESEGQTSKCKASKSVKTILATAAEFSGPDGAAAARRRLVRALTVAERWQARQTAASRRRCVAGGARRSVMPFRGVVLAPTRELVAQIARVVQRLARGAPRPWRVVELSTTVEASLKHHAAAAADAKVAEALATAKALLSSLSGSNSDSGSVAPRAGAGAGESSKKDKKDKKGKADTAKNAAATETATAVALTAAELAAAVAAADAAAGLADAAADADGYPALPHVLEFAEFDDEVATEAAARIKAARKAAVKQRKAEKAAKKAQRKGTGTDAAGAGGDEVSGESDSDEEDGEESALSDSGDDGNNDDDDDDDANADPDYVMRRKLLTPSVLRSIYTGKNNNNNNNRARPGLEYLPDGPTPTILFNR